MESMAWGFSFQARKQKVKSILGGKHSSKLRGRGLDFEEVRTYVPGDDIRNIDWKVTARTQKTHSKGFSEEKEKPALIVVDQSKSMFFGSVKRTKSVVAAELAALAAFRILKEGDRVGGERRGLEIVESLDVGRGLPYVHQVPTAETSATPTPTSSARGLRMLARCPGEFMNAV